MKRGMSTEGAIVLVVIFGIVMVVLAILYQVLFDVGNEEFSKAQCRTSLQLTRVVGDLTPDIMCVQTAPNFVPLQCSRRFLSVTDDDVKKEGESIRLEYNSVCPSVDPSASVGGQAKQGACLPESVIATEMANCWDTFFRGETPIFQQVEKDVFSYFEDKENLRACFVCAEVTLRTTSDIQNFKEGYLKQKKYSKELTYYNFLAENREAICNNKLRDAGGNCWEGTALASDDSSWFEKLLGNGVKYNAIDLDTLEKDTTYAITFVRTGMSTDCGQGDELPRDEYPTMSVHAIPSDKIHEYCGALLV